MTKLQLPCLLVMAAAAAAAQDSAAEWNDRGLAAAARGDQAEAERSYQQAIERWKSLGPAYQAHLAISQLNLGQTYSAQAKRREGAEIFEEALAKLRRTMGIRNEWTLTAMNLLGA